MAAYPPEQGGQIEVMNNEMKLIDYQNITGNEIEMYLQNLLYEEG